MQELRRICCSELTLLIVLVCSTPLVASIMLSIYAKLSSHVLAIRERAAINMQGTVFLSKIENRCLLYDCEM